MAEVVPAFVLPPNRCLVQEETPGGCIGTIVQLPDRQEAEFENEFKYHKKVLYSPPPENPEDPQGYFVEVASLKIIFNREREQEIKFDDQDYFIIHWDDILGFILPE